MEDEEKYKFCKHLAAVYIVLALIQPMYVLYMNKCVRQKPFTYRIALIGFWLSIALNAYILFALYYYSDTFATYAKMFIAAITCGEVALQCHMWELYDDLKLPQLEKVE